MKQIQNWDYLDLQCQNECPEAPQLTLEATNKFNELGRLTERANAFLRANHQYLMKHSNERLDEKVQELTDELQKAHQIMLAEVEKSNNAHH